MRMPAFKPQRERLGFVARFLAKRKMDAALNQFADQRRPFFDDQIHGAPLAQTRRPL